MRHPPRLCDYPPDGVRLLPYGRASVGFVALDPATDLWAPDSWRGRPALQQPEYPDRPRSKRGWRSCARLPPLVTSWEIVLLREQLAEAAAGQRFVLQGGDCAERFADCTSPRITNCSRCCCR